MRLPLLRASLISAALAGVLAVATGGGAASAAPRPLTPVEALPAFVARYQAAIAAIKAGDCAQFSRLNINGGLGVTCDERLRGTLDNFQLLGYRQFGTGAVIDVFGRDSEQLMPAVSTAELALGPDRRFRVKSNPIFGALSGQGIPQIATRPSARTLYLSLRTANLYLRSLRTRNCNLLFQTAFTDTLTRAQACARIFSAKINGSNSQRLRIQLAADPLVRPVRIGGTRDIQFYRLALRTGHYFTLIVDRGGTPTDLYLTSAQYVR